MIHEKTAALLNEQINKELYSAYLYWDMSHYFEFNGLDGFANWYTVQAQEERDHALIFYRYLVDNNINVELLPIEQPPKQLPHLPVMLHGVFLSSLIVFAGQAVFLIPPSDTIIYLTIRINTNLQNSVYVILISFILQFFSYIYKSCSLTSLYLLS